ncbi:MAG: zinc ribbon domain-containing protein [Candidatus Aenigmarchaeota archaeon]|nr:zinc ribbon domain-containing protein [Candidatus Aenigmarchaeota archaeon]
MFWSKKKCRNCDNEVKSDWMYCSNCGIDLTEKKHIHSEIDKDFRRIDKLFDGREPKFILKPSLKSKGISITITSDNMTPPKIEVMSSGEFKRKSQIEEPKPVRIPKVTEEPHTKIERKHDKQIITVDMPDVKSLDDIELKQLHQSIEIKAFAGDKAYFKLIPIPMNATVNNEFKDGVLKIEVVK